MAIDYISEIRSHQQAARRLQQEMLTTNPTLFESDEENYSDSYKWLRLPIVGETPHTIANMILSDIEVSPNDCLAGILVEAMRNQVPTGIEVGSMCIDRLGNSFHLCIEASTSLIELEALCEQYRALHGSEGQK